MRSRRVRVFGVASLLAICAAAAAQTRVVTPTPAELARAESIGLAHLRAQAARRGITDDLKATRVSVDAAKMAHVHVQQFHRGVPVFGGEAIAHLNAAGEPVGETDNLVSQVSVDPSPRIAADAAAARAVVASNCSACVSQSIDLRIIRKDDVDHLAYRVQLRQPRADLPPSIPVIFIDAHNGSVLLRYDNLQTMSK